MRSQQCLIKKFLKVPEDNSTDVITKSVQSLPKLSRIQVHNTENIPPRLKDTYDLKDSSPYLSINPDQSHNFSLNPNRPTPIRPTILPNDVKSQI